MVDGTDVFSVYAVMSEVVAKARSGGGPSLIEARMYRITPHSSDDDDRSYRTREEVEENKKRDPILVTRTQLLESGVLSARELEEMESRAKAMVDDAVAYTEKAPYPAVEEAAYPVYVEEVRRA